MKKFPIVSIKKNPGKSATLSETASKRDDLATAIISRVCSSARSWPWARSPSFFFVKLFYEIMAGLSRAALGAGTAVTFRKQQIFLDVKKWPLRQKTRANNCIHKVQQHLNLPLWLVLIVTKYNRGQYLASKFRPSLNFGVSPPSHHSTTPLGRWCCCDCWWRNVRESRQKLRKSPNKICENSPPIYDMYLGTYYFVSCN